MHRLFSCYVSIWVEKGYISRQEAPWLLYALERKTAEIITAIPVLGVGCLFAPITTVVSFYLGFRTLRTYTNGYHAGTVLGCALCSVILECFALGFILKHSFPMIMNVLLIFSAAIIAVASPYNHPNIKFTPEERIKCGRCSRLCLAIQIMTILILRLLGFDSIAEGLLLGIVMTAVMLVIAYLHDFGGM